MEEFTGQDVPTTKPTTKATVRIRQAEPDDAMAVASVHCRAAIAAYASIFDPSLPKPTPESLTPEWLGLIAADGGRVLLAERTDGPDRASPEAELVVVGCVAIRPDDAVPTGLLLARLYVEPSLWGCGIGAKLHDAALVTIVEGGATSANLWVLEPNERARAMYERRGWRLVPGPTQANIDPDVVDVLYQWDHPEPSNVEAIVGRVLTLVDSRVRSESSSPVLVALDGRSGVGKSTLADAVATRLIDLLDDGQEERSVDGLSACAVIDGDDFYAGGTAEDWDARSAEEKVARGIDWQRQRPVLTALAELRPGSWQGYDWDAFDGRLDVEATVCQPASVVILEGAYSGRPELADLFDLRVLVEAPTPERHRRLARRDGDDYRDDWLGRWTEAEDLYFTDIGPPSSFDLVVQSRGGTRPGDDLDPRSPA